MLALALLLGGLPASADDSQDDNGGPEGQAIAAEGVDRLALAALLISDGNYRRAASVLAQVDPAAEELDRARFYTLRGLARLNLAQWQGAREDLDAALAAGATEPVLHIYLAQAHFQLGNYREALEQIEFAGQQAGEYPSLYLLRAEANWKLGDRVGAFTALQGGAARYPDQPRFLRRQVFYLMEMGLYREAAQQGRRYLEQIQGQPADYIAIAVALHRAGQSRAALALLEAARLRFPYKAEVSKALAQVYFEQGQLATAANIYDQAAAIHPHLIHDAAEFHRRAGQLFRALYLNAQIDDPKKKLRQRVAILVELERFAQVAGAEAALNRVGLLADQDIRYALAYAHFKTGNYDAAERHLQRLTDSGLVRQATQLRQYMRECRGNTWLCA